MKRCVLILATLALTVTGCQGSPDPIRVAGYEALAASYDTFAMEARLGVMVRMMPEIAAQLGVDPLGEDLGQWKLARIDAHEAIIADLNAREYGRVDPDSPLPELPPLPVIPVRE